MIKNISKSKEKEAYSLRGRLRLSPVMIRSEDHFQLEEIFLSLLFKEKVPSLAEVLNPFNKNDTPCRGPLPDLPGFGILR